MTKVVSLFVEEYELARAIKQGDQKALKFFYEKYSGKMLAICMRYLSDRMLAEDVMIEAFMKIFDKIGQFSFQGSFEGWVKRIMVNESLMKLRSMKMLELDIESQNIQLPSTSMNDSLAEKEILAMIMDLPAGYRTVFNLYAIEGFSHAEIAEKLGISEGTSKSQLSRARAILQSRINESEKGIKQNFD